MLQFSYQHRSTICSKHNTPYIWNLIPEHVTPEQIQISEKATTKIQDVSISNNRKEKSRCIKKKDPKEIPECLESFCKKPRLKKFLFLEI